MKCINLKDSTFGSGLFCKTCGMDIGLRPIRTNNMGTTELYCCEDCAKIRGHR